MNDDIDVVMPRPYYIKFLELTCKNGLGAQQYDVLSYKYNEKYIYVFAKISDRNTVLIGKQ